MFRTSQPTGQQSAQAVAAFAPPFLDANAQTAVLPQPVAPRSPNGAENSQPASAVTSFADGGDAVAIRKAKTWALFAVNSQVLVVVGLVVATGFSFQDPQLGYWIFKAADLMLEVSQVAVGFAMCRLLLALVPTKNPDWTLAVAITPLVNLIYWRILDKRAAKMLAIAPSA